MTASWLQMRRPWSLKKETTHCFKELALEGSNKSRLFWSPLSSMVLYWLMLGFLCFPLRVFGHFSLRSEWQLVKVDYKSLFSRRCTKEDFETWHLLNQVPLHWDVLASRNGLVFSDLIFGGTGRQYIIWACMFGGKLYIHRTVRVNEINPRILCTHYITELSEEEGTIIS